MPRGDAAAERVRELERELSSERSAWRQKEQAWEEEARRLREAGGGDGDEAGRGVAGAGAEGGGGQAKRKSKKQTGKRAREHNYEKLER